MVTEDAISTGYITNLISESNPPVAKKKRNLPGNPDPEAEVIALSPKTLMATNRFICEICGKGFQRDQNLQLHRRGHNLPWKLKQRTNKEAVRKRVYVCPEKTCVHNHPSRALGDLTGIKKHFSRKHGEKKYKCDKCSKRYAVHSDWKAHSKTCGTREYRCDCGSIFSRRDSFITHRAFCEALAEETARLNATSHFVSNNNINLNYHGLMGTPFVFGPSISHKPLFSSNDTLWNIGQGPQTHDAVGNIGANLQETHQIGLLDSRSLLINNDPLVSYSNPPSSDNLHQLNWILGKNSLSSSANSEEFMTTTSSVLLSNSVSKDALSTAPCLYSKQDMSTPCLYSKQHQVTTLQAESVANNSATALLQKAAEIGSTPTDPTFLMSFGSTTSSVNCKQLMAHDGNKCGDLLGSNSLVTSLGSDHDTENSTNEISTMNQMQTQPAKRRRVKNGEGQTRDFLGVGVESICSPSSIAGWI